MARKYKDYLKDEEMLGILNIGDRVKYTEEKIGTVSKFTKYSGSYSIGYKEYRRNVGYTSVSVLLDGGGHINVSPRNLVKLN